jgi:tetratricopeptide (TPR) repeat protein
MGDDKLVITESGFLTEFLNQHTQRTDRPFCFILGAGVSRSSGIPTGGEMARVWLQELHEATNFDGLDVEAWATPERLEIEGFAVDKLPNFYPQLYQRRYGEYEQGGYAFLESQMEGKEPSYGYSVLSYLLSETQHRVVITTNFDNLVADALSIHSSRFPLVIGHDALAQYAAVELRRPLVAKVHGALGFSPKSQPNDISHLPEGWRIALGRILDRYTPIVIGYEGNDGSLMGFLKSLPKHTPDRIFWCVYAPDAKGIDCLELVSSEVREYVESRRGRFVPIRGFDELMAKLLTKLREKGSVPDLYERLKERARQRERNYDEQQRRLFEAAVASEPIGKRKAEPRGLDSKFETTKADPALSEAVSEIADSRKDKPWWVWTNEADAELTVAAKEKIYLQALDAFPNNVHLLRDYAITLERSDEYDKAEDVYKRALAAHPKDSLTLVFYGDFLLAHRNNPEHAEEFYKRALEADPSSDYVLASYADLLHQMGKDLDKAEDLYEKALEINPQSRYALGRFSVFMRDIRGDPEKAEELARRSDAVK